MKKIKKTDRIVRENEPLYVMSVASRICSIPEWTLRMIDKEGILSPARSRGEHRIYSQEEIKKLLEIKKLMKRKINREGIRMIMTLRRELEIVKIK